ncbi:MAG TPA: rhombosortase [Chromatiaceae bacterium]|nr:rhombosortase [Chromatiaceae bacterium]
MFTEHQLMVRHGSFRLPWRTLLLTLVAIGIYWLLGAAPEAWVFDRLAIAEGEWWRLITGHWVHSDGAHALWDVGALMLLGFLFERQMGNQLFSILLAASLAVDAWIWWGQPSLAYYCGLSGILNALMAVGLLRLWQEMRHPLILLTGLGFAAKVVIELTGGQMLLSATAWPGVPGAHAVGLICGMLYTWIQMLIGRREKQYEIIDYGCAAGTVCFGTGKRRGSRSRSDTDVSDVCRIR